MQQQNVKKQQQNVKKQQQMNPPINFGWPGGRQGGQGGNRQVAAAPAARFHIQIPRVQQKKQQELQQPLRQQQQQRKSQQKRQQQQRKSQRQRQQQRQEQLRSQLQRQKQKQQQIQSQLQRQKQQQQQFVQQTQRQQQHKCPRTEKDYWNTVDQSIRDLANSNIPIPTELAHSTRNTLVQEFGHTPQEAKYLVNLRMSNLVTRPSIQRSISQPSQSVSWLQGGSKIGQSSRQQSCNCKRKEQKVRKSKKTKKKKSRMLLGNNLILDSGAKYIYMNEFPEFQILFTKVAAQLLKTKIPKGKILTKADASFIRKIIHKKPIPGYRTVNYPQEFRFRPTQETQMARRLAKHNERKITSKRDHAAAKYILKEL